MMKKMRHFIFGFAFAALCVSPAAPAFAAQVTLTGDSNVGPVTTGNDGKYTLANVPLRRNSVNRFTITAKDGNQTQSKEILITQISLESVVVSKIKSTPLTVQEIEQLVNDGVIDIDDPANFNVSKFQIVLTIGGREVPIDIPMVRQIEQEMGQEDIAPQSDPGDGRSSNPNPPEIVIFEVFPPPLPGQDPPPPIPGVLLIEGRIKTLKEFYSVRLLLMNTSGIFTLHDVTAELVFPDGGLSHTLPADGIVQFGDILPGDAEVPGQKEREFIIRGDEIGIRKVKVNFGGTLIGPGIPEDESIPFNGSAETTVEVKGPPEFRVQVIHPPAVVQDVPYELIVDIQNIGQTPALYTSFELDVGADGTLVDCMLDENEQPICIPLEGSAVRNIGHLLPGQSTRQSFMINPHATGPITSCLAVADQNIDLQVHLGNLGCLVGVRPIVKSPDGVPTMSVVPTANALGVSIESPVVAFFNEEMNQSTITIGPSGTIKVFDEEGNLVPGELRVVPLGDHTAAIFQVKDNITNRWKGNHTYSIEISENIFDLQGLKLESGWTSEFTTTDPNNDQTPPTLTLSIEPPVNPSNVLPGQIIRLNAYAADQGTKVQRVELRMQDTDVLDSVFELIDQKTIFADVSEATIFSVDSANLIPGHTYQFKATAFDNAGNSQDATIAAILAQNAAPPVIELPENLTAPVLHGVSVSIKPKTLSASVNQVDYYLDGEATPFATLTIAPFSTTLGTLGKAFEVHTIRAVATDGLGQTGEDTFTFELVENLNEPVVNFGSAVDGSQYVLGALVGVNGGAEDPTGITSVAFFLDDPNGAPIATTTEPFNINTQGLALGAHQIYFKATNKLGLSNDLNDAASILEFEILPEPPPNPPPAKPVVTDLSFPVNGKATIKGTAAAGGKVTILNTNDSLSIEVFAAADGKFETVLDAEDGDLLHLTVLNLSQSILPSAITEALVPNAPVLDHITVTPSTKTFSAVNEIQDITVTGFFDGGATQNLTAAAAFSSSNSSIAAVNAAGRIVALANGNVEITASVLGKEAKVNVTVSIVTLTSISMTPSSFEIFGTAKTQQLTVIGHYSNGTTAPISANQVSFGTSNTGIALVNPNGVVTSVAFGQATIVASFSGFPPAQSAVKVSPISVTGISVAPNSILFTDANETRQLDVTAELSDGTSAAPAGLVEYESLDTNIATVNASGLVTAVANGEVGINVKHAGFAVVVSVIVDISTDLPPPEILSLDRTKAGEGDVFVIRGLNFAAVPADNEVLVNGVAAQVQSARQDELEAVVPEGATSGPVTVEVDGQISNSMNLIIYGRTAQTLEVTLAVDIPASPGTKLNFPGKVIDFRAGDKVFLSSAPDILAPLSFTGTLRFRIDGGSFNTINPSANAVDLTSFFTPGEHTLDLELSESSGKFKTEAIYVVAGPNNTGAISGFRSVVGLAQSRQTPVTFINLKDNAGNPLPDGSKVAITIQQIGVSFPNPPGGCCVNSVGGTIVNGQGTSPNDSRFSIFTVQGGRVNMIYDPLGASGLESGTTAVARAQVIPADANGSRIGFTATQVAEINLGTIDSAATPRSQSSAIADGVAKIVTVKLLGIRDSYGQIVPNGAKIAITTGQIGVSFPNPPGGCCVNSVGGAIVNGEAVSPNDSRFSVFTVTNGEVEVHYDTGGVLLGTSDVQIANLQFLPADANGSRIGFRAFTVVPITLSSPNAPVNVAFSPTSLLADGGDNRTVITLSNLVDAIGNPVPNGTKIAATTAQIGVTPPTGGCCVNSAGGTLINGEGVPANDTRFFYFTVQNGQVEIVYSSSPVSLSTLQNATARVQILPAAANGNIIGFKAFAVVDINLAGVETAEATAQPPGVIADGEDLVTVTVTGIRDTQGNLVPDGSKIAVTTAQIGVSSPDGSCCVNSAGGAILNGLGISSNDTRFSYFTVNNAQAVIQYDPAGVLVETGNVVTANLQFLPARPDGTIIGFRAFRIVPITLSSVSALPANVVVLPASVLADGGDNQSDITVSQIKDAVGNLAPNGTKIAVTTSQIGVSFPDGSCCVNSAGGTIANSSTLVPNDTRFKVITIQSAQAAIKYSAAPVTLESRATATTRVQILPADKDGKRIGFRAFAIGEVTLAGYFSADISGPGTLAPNASANYVVSNIRDTSGNLIPNGAKIAVTLQQIGVSNPDGGCCINSIGGSFLNGDGLSPNDNRFQTYTVTNGAITINYKAPANPGTAVIQLLPADPIRNRLGFKAFTVKVVEVS